MTVILISCDGEVLLLEVGFHVRNSVLPRRQEPNFDIIIFVDLSSTKIIRERPLEMGFFGNYSILLHLSLAYILVFLSYSSGSI